MCSTPELTLDEGPGGPRENPTEGPGLSAHHAAPPYTKGWGLFFAKYAGPFQASEPFCLECHACFQTGQLRWHSVLKAFPDLPSGTSC